MMIRYFVYFFVLVLEPRTIPVWDSRGPFRPKITTVSHKKAIHNKVSGFFTWFILSKSVFATTPLWLVRMGCLFNEQVNSFVSDPAFCLYVCFRSCLTKNENNTISVNFFQSLNANSSRIQTSNCPCPGHPG